MPDEKQSSDRLRRWRRQYLANLALPESDERDLELARREGEFFRMYADTIVRIASVWGERSDPPEAGWKRFWTEGIRPELKVIAESTGNPQTVIAMTGLRWASKRSEN